MSASLDDMEPYEIFQQELDNYAREYEKDIRTIESKNKVLSELNIIHSFIEFVCFHKAVYSFKGISHELIFSDFPQFRVSDETDKRVLTDCIMKFLLFIKKQYGKGNEELTDNLKY